MCLTCCNWEICGNDGQKKTEEISVRSMSLYPNYFTKTSCFTGILTSDVLSFAVPSGRWGHAACRLANEKVLVVGGQGEKHQLVKDSLWLLDTSMVTKFVGFINYTQTIPLYLAT